MKNSCSDKHKHQNGCNFWRSPLSPGITVFIVWISVMYITYLTTEKWWFFHHGIAKAVLILLEITIQDVVDIRPTPFAKRKHDQNRIFTTRNHAEPFAQWTDSMLFKLTSCPLYLVSLYGVLSPFRSKEKIFFVINVEWRSWISNYRIALSEEFHLPKCYSDNDVCVSQWYLIIAFVMSPLRIVSFALCNAFHQYPFQRWIILKFSSHWEIEHIRYPLISLVIFFSNQCFSK